VNIFVLHKNPTIAARMHCDKHVVKMILESAQMLCTAISLGGLRAPYKPTHKNHPCTVWARQSLDDEWMFRWPKNKASGHKSVGKYLSERPDVEASLLFPKRGLTPFAQAMPDECKHMDPVQAYRRYYLSHKAHILNYTNRKRPRWMSEFFHGGCGWCGSWDFTAKEATCISDEPPTKYPLFKCNRCEYSWFYG
jgi:hypothetical protein